MKKKMREEFFNENIREIINDELNGVGNFIKTTDYNILIKKIPDYLINIWDSAVNYWEDTIDFFDFEKERLDKNIILYSTQKYVSKSFIDIINSEIYNSSDIVLCYDKRNNLWLLNGHHRLIYDRMNGRDSMCYIIKFKDVEEIDDIFYGEDS
jgi:hypothetical protein